RRSNRPVAEALPRSPAPRPARPPRSASSLEDALQSGGVPGLGEIGLGIDAIGRSAKRREIDGVDRKPAILQRLHDGLFVGEPKRAAGLGGLARAEGSRA